MIDAIRRISVNLFIGSILLILTPALFKTFSLLSVEFFKNSYFYPMAVGTVLGLCVERYLNKHFPEVAVFEHEFTHAIAGLPFGFIPTGISVSRYHGGCCRHIFYPVGPFKTLYPLSSRIVSLAPYFLPTFTVIMVLFRPVTSATCQPWYDISIGATFGFHALSGFFELKRNYTNRNIISFASGELTKSDIGKTGMLFSLVFIAVATIIVHTLVLAVIVKGDQGFGFWMKEIWHYTNSFTLPSIVVHLFH